MDEHIVIALSSLLLRISLVVYFGKSMVKKQVCEEQNLSPPRATTTSRTNNMVVLPGIGNLLCRLPAPRCVSKCENGVPAAMTLHR